MAGSKIAASRSILHYDPDRTDYSVTESELQRLEEGGGAPWKDLCLASASIFLSSALNLVGILAGQEAFRLTLGVFFNSLAAGICMLAAIAFGLAWRNASRTYRSLVKSIRNKPRIILRAESLEVETEAKQEELLATK